MAHLEVHGRSVRSVSEKCGIMELRCVWILFFVTLAITLQQTVAVRVLVVRGNPDSRSEEDSRETLSAEESEEIDFLMDLIQNEARDSNPPPVTTVRVIKRKPEIELVAQHSTRKEKVQPQKKAYKEYHIHYHNHQHKGPVKPAMTFEEDSLHPLIWNSQLPLGDFDFYKQLQKSSATPYSERTREKSFKDFETFLRSNLKSSGEKFTPETKLEAFKDFDTLIKPQIPSFKTKDQSPFERMRKFHEYFDSEEKFSVPPQDRFAAFKDFSEIENADKSKSEEKTNAETPEKKNVKIKDFAIVIKSKSRGPQKENAKKQNNNNKEENTGPKIPPFVNKLRIPNKNVYDLPKVLEAAGGSPKYIDTLNQMKYPQPDLLNFPHFPLNLNMLEHDQRNLFNLRPYLPPPLPMRPLPRYPFRSNLNGWLLKRMSR